MSGRSEFRGNRWFPGLEESGLTRAAELALKFDQDPIIIGNRSYPDDPRQNAAEIRAKWATRAVLKLLPEASDASFDALYPLLKFGYRLGQVSKALGDLLFVAVQRRAVGGLLESGFGHLGGHEASPSRSSDDDSVGDGRPGPAGEVGPGHAESSGS